jgi:hypothetical protein
VLRIAVECDGATYGKRCSLPAQLAASTVS